MGRRTRSPAVRIERDAPPRRAVAPRWSSDVLGPCLLILLAEEPSHGYELLERLAGIGLPRNPGGVYRRLRRFEHEGLVLSAWEPPSTGPARRRYEITVAGARRLHDSIEAMRAAQRLLRVLESRSGGALRPVDLGA